MFIPNVHTLLRQQLKNITGKGIWGLDKERVFLRKRAILRETEHEIPVWSIPKYYNTIASGQKGNYVNSDITDWKYLDDIKITWNIIDINIMQFTELLGSPITWQKEVIVFGIILEQLGNAKMLFKI